MDAGGGGDGGFNPTEVARVAGWLANANTNGLSMSLNNGTTINSGASANINRFFPVGPTRDRLVNAIVGSCAAFAPPLANWILYCEAIISSAIVSESTYTPGMPIPGPPSSPSVVYDAYSTMNAANDPTVGLLQDRFSSTVHDFNYYGPLPKIAAIGCAWPAALTSLGINDATWHTLGGTATYLAFMEDPACNVPLATWYYFQNATGNGGPSAIYVAQYCMGQGVAGNMVVGLMSHLQGPAFLRDAQGANPTIETNAYPTGIDFRFTSLVGLPNTNPSPPFSATLVPSVTQYCK